MSILNIPIAKPWSVKLPALFRYMEQKWIDEFFAPPEVLRLRFVS